MWSLLLKAGLWALGLFFPAKDERDAAQATGEELGAAKAGQAAAVGEIHDIEAANRSRGAVTPDADAILLDKSNAGPASPRRTS